MLGSLSTGKMGFGMYPERVPVKLVNRVGTALLVGEVLMCDMENTAYDSTAFETGVFGNGITPAVSGTGGLAAVGLNWPMAVVTGGQGSAAGTVVDCLAQGITTVRAVNVPAAAMPKGAMLVYLPATSGRNPDCKNAALAAADRPLGYLLSTHTAAATVETVTAFFQGLESR